MRRDSIRNDRGSGLIVLILVTAFLLAVGIILLFVTGTGPQVAGNIRFQEQAFNAAEAGFDYAWAQIESNFIAAGWTNFDGHYITLPAGIDLPDNANYFRKLTDDELMAAIDPTDPNMIFYRVPYVLTPSGTQDPRYTYTAFLIDDEAGGGTPDAYDALLICIGVVQLGGTTATARLEIGLATQLPGGNP